MSTQDPKRHEKPLGDPAAVEFHRALRQRIRRARLPRRKTLESYDFTWLKPTVTQAIVGLFDCGFVDRRECAVFLGPSATGKSHLLTALGYAACEKGISVRFTRVVDMIRALTAARLRGTLPKTLRQYTKPQLLLLDELDYVPVDQRGAAWLFHVITARYESGSMVVTANREFSQWAVIFGSHHTAATAAMLDRLMHHGQAIPIHGRPGRITDRKTG